MILDKQSLFFEDLPITAAATYNSNAEGITPYDLGAGGRDIGPGELVPLFCQVTATATGGTSVQVKVVTDDDIDLGSPTILYSTEAILTAVLVAGYKFNVPAVPRNLITERYLGMIIISLGVDTTLTLTGGILWDQQTADAGWTAVTGF